MTPADGDLVGDGPIADICRRLDSLPLSVELAAARARHVGIGEIARRLDRPFDLLTAAPRTAVARQRSLRAVIDWSFALLGEAERELFTRLCVFENGFMLAGAEAVDPAAHAAWTLELLAGLVDKSLVVAVPEPDSGEMRYHLLETLRRYGLEQLAATSTGDAARRAHRAYFVGLAAAAAAGFMSSAYRQWRRRVERELPDLQAACRSAVASRAWDDALRIAGSLWWFWASTDRHRDGRRWLEDALRGPASEADPAARAVGARGARVHRRPAARPRRRATGRRAGPRPEHPPRRRGGRRGGPAGARPHLGGRGRPLPLGGAPRTGSGRLRRGGPAPPGLQQRRRHVRPRAGHRRPRPCRQGQPSRSFAAAP